MPSPQKTQRRSHDRLFKEFLERFLPEFLTLFFPDKATRLNFSTLRFLDKELAINLPGHTLRITDLLAEIETLDNQPELILLHVEIEARKKKTLPRRMFEYYSLLRVLQQKPVFPVAIVLLPKAGGFCWQTYTETLCGEELVRFRYGQIGLRDLQSQDFLQQANPIAAALAALMQAGREPLAHLKLHILETIVHSDLAYPDKLFLSNLVEVYLPHPNIPRPGELDMTITSELDMYTDEEVEARLTEYRKTYIEIAIEETEKKAKKKLYRERRKAAREGRAEGKRTLLLKQLEARFGPLSNDLITRLHAITDDKHFDELSIQILTAHSLDELNLPKA
jgi:hypothetical protein